MNDSFFPLLSFLIALPMSGAILISACRQISVAKLFALVTAVLELMLTVIAVKQFDPESVRFQLTERYAAIPAFNMEFFVGIDGFSVLLLPMTAIVMLSVILASWQSTSSFGRFHFVLLLLLESAAMGIFTALDMALFFICWELTLLPLFILISTWGIGPKRRYAALKYTLLMLMGSAPILVAIILLVINHVTVSGGSIPGDLAFSYPLLLQTAAPESLQSRVFVLFFVGFAINAPLFPFHTWLPTVTMEGPAPLTAIVIGIKLGIFGIIRFAMPLAPSAAVQYSWMLGIIGAITLIYCSLIALKQSNLQRLLAYVSISHVGLVMIGLSTLTVQGIQGAIMTMANFALVFGSLMLLAGLLHHRLGSTDLAYLGGITKLMPRLTSCYFIFVLAIIAMPGTVGFPAELLMVIGTLLAHPSLVLIITAGAVLNAATLLSLTRHAFLRPMTNMNLNPVQDLSRRELTLLGVPAILAVLFGFFPNSVLNINKKTAEVWLSRFVEQPDSENRDFSGLN